VAVLDFHLRKGERYEDMLAELRQCGLRVSSLSFIWMWLQSDALQRADNHAWLDAQTGACPVTRNQPAVFAPAIGELHGRFVVLTASEF